MRCEEVSPLESEPVEKGKPFNEYSLELNEKTELPTVADEENEPLTKLTDGKTWWWGIQRKR